MDPGSAQLRRDAQTPAPPCRGERSPPTTCSAAEPHPASICERRGCHAGFKRRFAQIAYSWQLQSARVHGGLLRPSFTENRKDRNICERSLESSAEAGEQFQPVPSSAGGSIRERLLRPNVKNRPRETCSRSVEIRLEKEPNLDEGLCATVRALICKSKVQLHFLLRRLTFRHLTPAHSVNS